MENIRAGFLSEHESLTKFQIECLKMIVKSSKEADHVVCHTDEVGVAEWLVPLAIEADLTIIAYPPYDKTTDGFVSTFSIPYYNNYLLSPSKTHILDLIADCDIVFIFYNSEYGPPEVEYYVGEEAQKEIILINEVGKVDRQGTQFSDQFDPLN